MPRILTRLKKILLYAGLEKEEYDRIQELYLAPNRLLLQIFSALLAVLTFGFTLIAFRSSSISNNRFAYGGICVIALFVFIWSLTCADRKNIRFLSVLGNLLTAATYWMGILNGTLGDPDRLALTFMVLIVVVPLLFNARPILTLLEMLTASLVFIAMTICFKADDVITADIADTLAFASVSIVLLLSITLSKARGYLNQWQAIEAKKDLGRAFQALSEQKTVLQETLDSKHEQYAVLESVAGIFYSMHVIDLVHDTATEFKAQHEVKEIVNHRNGAREMMVRIISTVTVDQYQEAALAFTDLTTIGERMKGQPLVTAQFIGKRIGWFRAMFIAMETGPEGRPLKVVFSTQCIEEEKQQEEHLIRKSKTDELTGFYNRRAFDEDLYEGNEVPEEADFVYLSLDVNGLKIVNDTLGHAAGDELIMGACACMKCCLGSYGRLYRTGGDEFAAIIFCSPVQLLPLLENFDRTVSEWSGDLVGSLSISYGFVTKEEEPDMAVRDLAILADKRMYEAKSAHYRSQGFDRRGQQDIHRALHGLYTKILKVNLTEDSYQIIAMDEQEKTAEKGFSLRLSDWLTGFGASGQVHPDDLNVYRERTDPAYLHAWFREHRTPLRLIYKRRIGDVYRKVLLEIIPASDHTAANESLFLYVKDIDTTS